MALDSKSTSDHDRKPNFQRFSPFTDSEAENEEHLQREAFNDDLPLEDPADTVIDINESEDPEDKNEQPPAAVSQVQSALPPPPKPPILRTVASPVPPSQSSAAHPDARLPAHEANPRPTSSSQVRPVHPTAPWNSTNRTPPQAPSSPAQTGRPLDNLVNERADAPAVNHPSSSPGNQLNGPPPIPRIPRASLSKPAQSPILPASIMAEPDPKRQLQPLRTRIEGNPIPDRRMPSIRPIRTLHPPEDVAPANLAGQEIDPSMTALARILPLRPASLLPIPPEKVRPQPDPDPLVEETNSQPVSAAPVVQSVDETAFGEGLDRDKQEDKAADVIMNPAVQNIESFPLPGDNPPGTADDNPVEPVIPTLPSNFTLADLLDSFKHIPAHTAVIGVCDDGAPILFDLLDDRTGPLLVLGDHPGGNTALLQTIIETAIAYNPAEDVRFLVLTSQPRDYVTLAEKATRTGHCLGIYNSQDLTGGEQILRAVGFAEQRYSDGKAGPPILLILDDLQFILKMDSDVRLDLEWLLKNGPTAHIWPLASLPTQAALQMGRWTSYFHSRMIGRMPENAAHRLGIFTGAQSEILQTGKEFTVHVNDDWLRFQLPNNPITPQTGGLYENRPVLAR